MKPGVGAGIYCSKLGIRQPIKLPDHSSIFQAEVFAVGKAAELAYTRTRKNSTINIYVDSQAAIRAISSYCIKSKNVRRSREAIERLAGNSRLHIYWVPGHKGIMGNEIVDEIAKSAVRLPFEQENDIPKPLNTIYNEMDHHMKRRVEARWTNLTTCKTAKVMCRTNDKKLTQFVLTLSRKECRTIIGMLTGHNLLAAHAYKIGIANTDKCRKCREDVEETLEHLLCVCPALLKTRLKCLGCPLFEGLEDISKRISQLCLDSPKALTSYMMSTFGIHRGRSPSGIARDQKVYAWLIANQANLT